VTLTAKVLVRLPDFPVIVIFVVPAAAPAAADNVRVLEPVVLAGLKDPVTPDGNPETLSATVPVNPFAGTTVMGFATLEPCATETVASPAEIVKDAGVCELVS
jgi:hypothetical protein